MNFLYTILNVRVDKIELGWDDLKLNEVVSSVLDKVFIFIIVPLLYYLLHRGSRFCISDY